MTGSLYVVGGQSGASLEYKHDMIMDMFSWRLLRRSLSALRQRPVTGPMNREYHSE